MATRAEENYLKAIFKIVERDGQSASTNAIALELDTSPASVTDMIKRLAEKEVLAYKPYHGVSLTDTGRAIATQLVRRHRLWELFLAEKLNFNWAEVHAIAEELEHVQSEELIDRLDAFLGFPKYDPHGDPIPNSHGKFTLRSQVSLLEISAGKSGTVVGVREHSTVFLNHLDELGIVLRSDVSVLEEFPYDGSRRVAVSGKEHVLSEKVAKNIYVKPG